MGKIGESGNVWKGEVSWEQLFFDPGLEEWGKFSKAEVV